MPVRRFTDLKEAEDAYADLEKENIELKAAAKNSVGGFLSRNEKLVTGLLAAILLALGGGVGGAWYQSDSNSKKIAEVTATQQEIKKTAEQVGSGVNDVKRELKKKGPFE